MTEALPMDEEAAEDRWSIGDLRDRSQMPNVDHFLGPPEITTPPQDDKEIELRRLRRRVEELERHLGKPTTPTASLTTGYTLFFLGNRGYQIVDADGTPPAVGATIAVAGERFSVDAIRRSPFPSDNRPCLVLSPSPSPKTSDPANAAT